MPTAAGRHRSRPAASASSSRSGRPTGPAWCSRARVTAAATMANRRSTRWPPTAPARRASRPAPGTTAIRAGRRMARSSPSRPLATAIARSTSMGADGTNPVRLTNSPAAIDHHPAFSPDGSKIVYASGPSDSSLQIQVMNADGSGTPIPLTSSPGRNQYPKWSPDGSRIAFASTRDGNFEIYVMNADGSGQTRLTTSATPDYDPAFSPDGTLLAWSATDTGGANQIFTMSSGGGPATQLTTGEGAFQPDWQALAPEAAPPGDPDPLDPPAQPQEPATRPLRIARHAVRLTRRGVVRVRLRCLLDEVAAGARSRLALPRRKRARASRRPAPAAPSSRASPSRSRPATRRAEGAPLAQRPPARAEPPADPLHGERGAALARRAVADRAPHPAAEGSGRAAPGSDDRLSSGRVPLGGGAGEVPSRAQDRDRESGHFLSSC